MLFFVLCNLPSSDNNANLFTLDNAVIVGNNAPKKGTMRGTPRPNIHLKNIYRRKL